jgi:hypothetical protein
MDEDRRHMLRHCYRFVEEYDGLIGFGFDRETNAYTLTYYLQKFAEDRHMAIMRDRMSDSDMEELFNLLGRFLKQYLTEAEYHDHFLKEKREPASRP